MEETYTLKIGKQKQNHAIANETTISFKNTHGAIINIDLRAYNNGVAFRYKFDGPPKKVVIKKEFTEFVIPEGRTWLQNYSMPAQWNPSYEENYMNGVAVGSTAKDSSVGLSRWFKQVIPVE